MHEDLSRWVLSCFDRQLEPRWTRSVGDRVNDWLVDEDGWVYLGIPGPNNVVDGEIIAVTPNGAIAWRLATTIGPDRIMLVGDDLCVIPDPTDYPEPAAQIVCVSPRHGRHDEPWGQPGPRSRVSAEE